MSHRAEPWHPTIPPKTNAVAALADLGKSSAALKGATQAFALRAADGASQNGTNASNSARAAALVAGRGPAGIVAVARSGNVTPTQSGYSRGRRPNNTLRVPSDGSLLVATRLSSTSVSPLRNVPTTEESASGIAARVASANTSPSRKGSVQHSTSAVNLHITPILPRPRPPPEVPRRITADSADARAARIARKPQGIDLKGIDEDDSPSRALEDLRRLAKSKAGASSDVNNERTVAPPETRPIPTRPLPPGRMPSKSMFSPDGAETRDTRTGMTESALADAIVASSLASSRASSPSKATAELALSAGSSRPHSLIHGRHHHHQVEPLQPNHTGRTLKETLRKRSNHDEKDEDEELVKRGRRHLMRKHVHKHHEGDRKRWRDKVTERERKRYEGVWAANRGLYIYTTPTELEPGNTLKPVAEEANMVVNVVVREIWERSRLAPDTLEEVWDLVVSSEEGKALKRDEFVVGLWLIDQRLKGRKLPIKVSPSVWSSVRHTQGVKVSNRPL